MKKGRHSGFSLLEMVVAGALLSIMVVTVGAVTVQAARYGRTVEEASFRAQVLELASGLLIHDLRRAGYSGTDAGSTMEPVPAIEIEPADGAGGDAIVVRFIEDEVGTQELRVLRFNVSRDSNRIWNLYLRDTSGTRQPAVQGVRRLNVRAVRLPGGTRVPVAELPQVALGLELELEFVWGETEALSIEFPIPRLVELAHQ